MEHRQGAGAADQGPGFDRPRHRARRGDAQKRGFPRGRRPRVGRKREGEACDRKEDDGSPRGAHQGDRGAQVARSPGPSQSGLKEGGEMRDSGLYRKPFFVALALFALGACLIAGGMRLAAGGDRRQLRAGRLRHFRADRLGRRVFWPTGGWSGSFSGPRQRAAAALPADGKIWRKTSRSASRDPRAQPGGALRHAGVLRAGRGGPAVLF